ncbi:MAG: MBL fold metallo-hydrolase [Microthrixaceae bacterium]
MNTHIHEIADQVFRLSTVVPDAAPGGFTFNQYLLSGDEPLLFHTGPRQLFPLVREAVAKVIEVDQLRWISFGHVESDESGAMNLWLDAASDSQVLFNPLGAMVSLNDLCDRPPVIADPQRAEDIGGHVIRTVATPHVPHGWEAQVIFDETTRTLFCGDLFTQVGEGPALVHDADLIQPALDAEDLFGATALTSETAPTIRRLADLEPRTLALMHGPAYAGDCRQALLDLADVYEARVAASFDLAHQGAL